MTKPYNSTILGMKNQLISNFKKVTKDSKTYYEVPTLDGITLIDHKDIFIMAQIVYNIIFEEYPSIKELYEYFINITRLMVKLEVPISWRPPSGLKIIQSYRLSSEHKVSISWGGKRRKFVLRMPNKDIDKRKQVNAIIPNIIHSLDASHLFKVIDLFILNDINPFISIHDCFGSHPNNIEKMSYLVKVCFVDMYTKIDFLDSFHNDVIKNIMDYYEVKDNKVLFNNKLINIPTKPNIGILKLINILDSKYIIN